MTTVPANARQGAWAGVDAAAAVVGIVDVVEVGVARIGQRASGGGIPKVLAGRSVAWVCGRGGH